MKSQWEEGEGPFLKVRRAAGPPQHCGRNDRRQLQHEAYVRCASKGLWGQKESQEAEEATEVDYEAGEHSWRLTGRWPLHMIWNGAVQ